MSQEPVEVTVVDDKRDTFGKRLGFLALGVLVLLFAILAYRQLARNGKDIRDTPPAKITVTVKPTPLPQPTIIIQPPVVVVPTPRVSFENQESNRGEQPRPRETQKPNPKPSQTQKPKPSPSPSPTCIKPLPVVPIGICP